MNIFLLAITLILSSACFASSISEGKDIPGQKDGQAAAVCDGNCYTSLSQPAREQCHGKKAGDLSSCAAQHLGGSTPQNKAPGAKDGESN